MTYTNFRPRKLATAALSAGLLATAACDTDEIVAVDDPDRVRQAAISDSSALPAVLGAARADFQAAFSGGGGTAPALGSLEGQVLQSGFLADEIRSSDTFPTRIEVDRRSTLDRNATAQDIFRQLGRARNTTETAVAAFGRFIPTSLNRAEASSLAGYTYVMYGENYCSGVPISEVDEAGEFVYGQPLPTDSLFRRAIARFDSATAIATAAPASAATAATRNLNLARVGKARSLLNIGRFAEAATEVAAVPTTFVYNVEHSANTLRQNNGIWSFSNNQGRFSVANREGGNGLPFIDDYVANQDPRIPSAVLTGALRRGQASTILRVTQQKYPDIASPVPLATGVEARLIAAEAALRAGDAATWLATLNTLRATTSLYQCPQGAVGCTNRTTALPALADPGTAAARVDLHFKERAYWLFLTGHRLGDMRRLLRQYGRNAETVYPTGTYTRPSSADPSAPIAFGTYGTDVSLPVPIDELNNPNLTEGCDNSAAGEDPLAP